MTPFRVYVTEILHVPFIIVYVGSMNTVLDVSICYLYYFSEE